MKREQFVHWCNQQVRWGDLDAFGHVNNTTYFTYCESARMFYFELLDLETASKSPAHRPAVVNASCNFKQMLHFPADLEVGVRTSKLGTTSFTLEYLIAHARGGEVVADGSSVVVWVDYQTQRSVELPALLVQRIRNLERDPP